MGLDNGALYRATYDPQVDATYIKIRDGKVARTSPVLDNANINIDLDERGRVLGIEVL